jgi:hypothetical protein
MGSKPYKGGKYGGQDRLFDLSEAAQKAPPVEIAPGS